MLLKPNKKVAQIYALFFIFFLALGAIFLTKQKDQATLPETQVSTPEGVLVEKNYKDLITVQTPTENARVTSPLEIRGAARGTWFFEATFPVVLVNWDGLIIAEGYAEATEDWMTEEFVPFKATLEFEDPSWEDEFSKRGTLILQKDNPSGLPENDDALELPIRFD